MTAELKLLPSTTLPAATLPYVQWALGHWQQIPQLAGDVVAVESAAGLEARWAAAKTAGDLLVSILADFPLAASPAAPEGPAGSNPVERRAGPVGANGQIIGLLLQNLPQILAFIQQIVPLFKGPAA